LIRALCATGDRENALRQHQISTRELRGAGEPNLAELNAALETHRSTPGAVIAPREPDAQLQQQIRFCTASDGVRIAYATVGQGPPLVKTANWLNHLEYDWDSPIWRQLFRRLGRDHQFIRYDARGNGLSDWDVEDISFDAFVRDLESVVDAAGLDRFPLLGISRGGPIAIAYAVKHPERVTHLALLHPLAGDVSLTSTFAVMRAFLPLMRITPPALLRRPMRAELIRWFSDPARARTTVDQYMVMWQKPLRWRQFLRQLAAISPESVMECTRRLSTIQQPVAIVASDDDPAVPAVALQNIRKALPRATLDIVKNVRHFSPEESPERIAGVIATLMRS